MMRPPLSGPKVLIVDDSAVVRQVLSRVLGAAGIQVLGAVADPLFAMQHMAREWPEVIVLDVEMPRMDGLTFLGQVMRERPTPVVICSSLTVSGAETTLQALATGAVGVVAKPAIGVRRYLLDGAADELVNMVRAAAQARVGRVARAATLPQTALPATSERVVAIGTSTGGVQALEQVLRPLPRLCPGLVIVQHMPEKFTALFAERLNSLCAITVKEAASHDRVLPGQALIAPGGRHLRLCREGAHYRVELSDEPAVNRHRPSVDVLFRSVAQCAGRNALGILLTGMGSDGAQGLRALRDAGAWTLAQDESSSVVFGMPKEAIKIGAAAEVIALHDVSAAILRRG